MWGLRNPWRFSFDRATGDTWIGDVGQNTYEEIDFAPRGEQGINWGWSLREGFHAFKGARPAGARDPIVEAPHTDGYCAIVGGYVYRGRAIPALDGVYLYGDDCRPDIEGLVQRGGHADRAARPRGRSVPDAHDVRRGRHRRALRRRARRHRLPDRRRLSGAARGALDHCAADAARDRVRRDRWRTLPSTLFKLTRDRDRPVLRQARRGRRVATSSASCHMNPGTSPAGTLAAAWNPVRVKPGHSTVTDTPVPFSSSCTASVNDVDERLRRAVGRRSTVRAGSRRATRR